MNLEKPVTTLEELIEISDNLKKIERTMSEEQCDYANRLYDCGSFAVHLYAYAGFLKMQQEQKENVKIKKLRSVTNRCKEYFQSHNSKDDEPCGILFYNKRNGELEVNLFNGKEHIMGIRNFGYFQVEYVTFDHILTMNEIKDWVYCICGVRGYKHKVTEEYMNYYGI